MSESKTCRELKGSLMNDIKCQYCGVNSKDYSFNSFYVCEDNEPNQFPWWCSSYCYEKDCADSGLLEMNDAESYQELSKDNQWK